MKFYKYHGIGNDFILIEENELPAEFSGIKAKTLCDRHTGIGADGVLLFGIGKREDHHATMTIYNSDGSQAEMCGNGIRCIVFHLLRRQRTTEQQFNILTKAGIKNCHLIGRDGNDPLIKVNMGQVSFESPDLPETEEGKPYPLELDNGQQFSIYPASVGNPHAIIKVESDEALMTLAQTIGPQIEKHPSFPHKTNVEFVRLTNDNQLDCVVFERGAGITQACGSGATAVTAVATHFWGIPKDSPITVSLPGGDLTMNIGNDNNVYMTGPASYAFSGEWPW